MLPNESKQHPILSHNDLPNAVRFGAGGTLVVSGWEFAGPTPPDWDIGYVLHSCTEVFDGGLNLAVAPEVIEGYASVAGERPSLDLSSFASAVNAWSNWFVSRMNVSLSDDERASEQATKELAHMLAHPLTRQRLVQIIQAAS